MAAPLRWRTALPACTDEAMTEAEVEDGPAIRPDGQRACAICGALVRFGFDVKVLEGREGRWSCWEYRDAVEYLPALSAVLTQNGRRRIKASPPCARRGSPTGCRGDSPYQT
jgi:hypothetical protein